MTINLLMILTYVVDCRYGLRVGSNDQLGPFSEIAIAGPISLAALAYKPTWRTAVPYGAMLVVMDGVNIYWRR